MRAVINKNKVSCDMAIDEIMSAKTTVQEINSITDSFLVEVYSSVDHYASKYGAPVFLDNDGNSYGQINFCCINEIIETEHSFVSGKKYWFDGVLHTAIKSSDALFVSDDNFNNGKLICDVDDLQSGECLPWF